MVEAPYIIASVKRLILSVLMALCPVVGMAQDAYPSRSVRMVIDTSPGGVTDLFGRLMAEALAQKLGQTVFVDNKPGASGNLAIDFLVRAAPDGYTLMIASGGGLVVKPYLKNGQLRPLATGAKRRIAGLPDLPTSAEAGLPRWEMSAWFGIFAPRGTPPAIVRLLNAKMQEVLDEPKLRERFFDAGADPIGGSVESFAERYRAAHRMWGDFIKETGIKQE